MSKPLNDVISALAKANKKEVFVVDASGDTHVIAAGKDDAAFREKLGVALASLTLSNSALHLHDWGGVIGEADTAGFSKLRTEVLSGGDHLVFSFTPWNLKGRGELPRMASFARDAGFCGLVITTQKEGKCGKADTFSALSGVLPKGRHVTYYEDTYSVLRDCTTKEGMMGLIKDGARTLQHVLAPDFPVEDTEKEGMNGLIQDGTRDEYLALWEAGGAAVSPVSPVSASSGAGGALSSVVPVGTSWQTLAEDVGALNEHMCKYSYVEGHVLSGADVALLAALACAPDEAEYPHAARWHKHVSHLEALKG